MTNKKEMFSLKRVLLVKAKDRLEKATLREGKRNAKLSKKEQGSSPVSNFFTEAKELIESIDVKARYDQKSKQDTAEDNAEITVEE